MNGAVSFSPVAAVGLSQPPAGSVVRDDAVHHRSHLVERQAVLVGVGLRAGKDCWLPGRVTDLSREGCRLVTAADGLSTAMTVQIMFPGFGAHRARLSWVDDDCAGAAFDPPLHPAIVDYIVRMSDPAARG